ncbi:CRC domain-containing protein TSO1-like [Rhodamnia argentea]|uniref:CRC domain-containing protein TSO1-like n=1 Tax=Rhodamnia argentea TaxID=178133 RepID=A0A8B8QB76_9MYRT|nr:CRC domain-containing protein TSO1-like [Rhodamnia argentea]
MDTPEKSQIAPPVPTHEDSPVFNFIRSLSPIKPVKSVNIAQTFTSLPFTSLPSVFTSPHANFHKNSSLLQRHQSLDPSNPDRSSGNQNIVCPNGDFTNGISQRRENSDKKVSVEVHAEPCKENSEFAAEFPQNSRPSFYNPEGNMTACSAEAESALETAGMLTPIIPVVVKSPGKQFPEDDGQEQNKEWPIDTSDLFMFSSPNDAEAFRELVQRSPDLGTVCLSSLMSRFTPGDVSNFERLQQVDLRSREQQQIEAPLCLTQEAYKRKEVIKNLDLHNLDKFLGKYMSIQLDKNLHNDSGTCVPFDYAAVPNFHRGLRRRCLDFEIAELCKLSGGDSDYSHMALSQRDQNTLANEGQLPVKGEGDPLRCTLPGVGLHLNALATTSNDYRSVEHGNLLSENQLMNAQVSSSSLNLPNSHQTLHESLTSVASEDIGSSENGVLVVQDRSQSCPYPDGEELDCNSPQKKRRKAEHSEDGACKRCNCKKSKCLKLYCECFAAGVYCIEPCACLDCLNKPIHEDTVLATRKQIESRNPLAFAPKVIRASDSCPDTGDESNKTPASARHKRGCNCKKSSCLKKYCECYQGGVGCSFNCRCEGCKNTFGRKDGSTLTGVETEVIEEEKENFEKSVVNQGSLEITKQRDSIQATPSAYYGPSIQTAYLAKNEPPRSTSFVTTSSSSGLHASQNQGKLKHSAPQPEFEKHYDFNNNNNDGGKMPEVLQSNDTPSTVIKTASPKCKRVSPPHSDFGSSPPLRNGRRLILKSIPSFPSLTQH